MFNHCAMSRSAKQREIREFVRKYQQKGVAKQAASIEMGGNLYQNNVWSHLFFDASKTNASGKGGKAKSDYPMIFPT